MWSAVNVQVGNPPQTVQVLPSTEIQPTWFVVAAGCTPTDPRNCTSARGGIYKTEKSSTYQSVDTYELGAEANLGLTQNFDNGAFAYDVLGVMTSDGGNVSLEHQVIAGIATKDFYVGNLGLSPLGINFTDRSNPKPSFLASLRSKSLIPSLSYGFTAGAYYNDKANASLTLGGYDTSKFTPNDISFTFGSQSDRTLTVALNAVTYTGSSSEASLLPNAILTLIDSTVPGIWLPAEACQSFEKAFGISYDPISNLYLVNDTLHDDLVKSGASVTFQISNSLNSGPATNITLPYSAFDLTVSAPLVNKPSNYFPLRRANGDSQYTLGRTFLQEAYIVVDHDRGNFSVSQATFGNKAPSIVAITPPSGQNTPSGTVPGNPSQHSDVSVVQPTSKSSSHAFPVGAIAGIAVAVVIITLICGTLAICYNLRKRRRRVTNDTSELAAHPTHPKGKEELEDTDRSRTLPQKAAATLGFVKRPFGSDKSSGASIVIKEVDDEDDKDEKIAGNDTNALIELSDTAARQRAELPSPTPWLRPELESPDPALIRSELSTPELGFRGEPSPLPSPHFITDSALASPSWSLPIQMTGGPPIPGPSSSPRRPQLVHGRQGSQESTSTRNVVSPITSPDLISSPFPPPSHPSSSSPLPHQYNRVAPAESATSSTLGVSSSRHLPHAGAVSPPASPQRPPHHRMSSIESQDSGISDPSTVGSTTGANNADTVSPILKPSRTSTASSAVIPMISTLAQQQPQQPQPQQQQPPSTHKRRPSLTPRHRIDSSSSIRSFERQDSFETRISEAQTVRRESFQSFVGRAREVEIVHPGRESPGSPLVRMTHKASSERSSVEKRDSAKSGLLSLQESRHEGEGGSGRSTPETLRR